jgi:hypothetical protein
MFSNQFKREPLPLHLRQTYSSQSKQRKLTTQQQENLTPDNDQQSGQLEDIHVGAKAFDNTFGAALKTLDENNMKKRRRSRDERKRSNSRTGTTTGPDSIFQEKTNYQTLFN